MSTRKETRQIRLASWKQIFADHAASGLSVRTYCEANNIKRDQYFYWQTIARKAGSFGQDYSTRGFSQSICQQNTENIYLTMLMTLRYGQ